MAVSSRKRLKNSLDVRSCVLGGLFSLPLVFFVGVVFRVFFSKTQSSGSNGTPPHALILLFLVLFLRCPAALVVSPILAARPASWRFLRGAFLGPARFWDSPGTLPRPFFLGTRGGRGVSWLLVLGLCFPLLFCSAASHVLLEGPANGSTYGRPGALDVPPLARVRAGGSPSEGGGLVPSCFWDLAAMFCLAEGHRDPRTHSVQGLLVGEGGVLSAPSGLFFSHALVTVFPRPRFFF